MPKSGLQKREHPVSMGEPAFQELQQKLVQQTNMLKQVRVRLRRRRIGALKLHAMPAGAPCKPLVDATAPQISHHVDAVTVLRHVRQVTQQSRLAETTSKRSQLTLRELQQLEEAVKCYESVGRA